MGLDDRQNEDPGHDHQGGHQAHDELDAVP
jgi:hypothetical protein